jgi:hypothetical protein
MMERGPERTVLVLTSALKKINHHTELATEDSDMRLSSARSLKKATRMTSDI